MKRLTQEHQSKIEEWGVINQQEMVMFVLN
jgi:hypothetical protein